MAAAYVQSAELKENTGATTIAVTLTGVTAGNLLVAYAEMGENNTIVLSDDKGNTWANIDTVDSDDVFAPYKLRTAYAKNVNSGTTVITATFGVSSDRRAIVVHEVSGCDTTAPLDQHTAQLQTSPGTGTDAISSGAITPSVDGCYLFGCSALPEWTSPIAAGTGFTQRQTENDGKPCYCTEDKVQTTAASIAATFTGVAGGTTKYLSAIVAFKPAGSGASAVPLLMQHYNG